MKKWVERIKTEYKDVLDIQYQEGYTDGNADCSAFRLHKLPGAPEELPLLDPRTVKSIPARRDW